MELLMSWNFRSTVLLFCALCLHGCGYNNYEECVLGEMKGQQASMQSTAEKVCERKFPYEKEIYSFRDGEFDIGWRTSYSNNISIEIASNEADYNITRAKMKFSTKSRINGDRPHFSSPLVSLLLRSASLPGADPPPQCGFNLLFETIVAERVATVGGLPDLVDQAGLHVRPKEVPVAGETLFLACSQVLILLVW